MDSTDFIGHFCFMDFWNGRTNLQRKRKRWSKRRLNHLREKPIIMRRRLSSISRKEWSQASSAADSQGINSLNLCESSFSAGKMSVFIGGGNELGKLATLRKDMDQFTWNCRTDFWKKLSNDTFYSTYTVNNMIGTLFLRISLLTILR